MWYDQRIQGKLRELLEATSEAYKTSLQEGLKLQLQALEHAKVGGDPYLIAETTRRLARGYYGSSEYDKSIRLFEEVIEYAEKAGEYWMLANACLRLGISYLEVHRNDEAERCCLESVRICEQHNICDIYIWALVDTSMMYRRLTQFHLALDYAYRARREFENTPPENFDDDEISYLNRLIPDRLANILLDVGDFNSALAVFKDEILPSIPHDNTEHLALTYHNIGCAYFELKKHENAIDFYSRSLDIFSNYRNIYTEILSLAGIAECYRATGKFDKAEAAIDKAYQLTQQTQVQSNLAYVLAIKGNLLFERDDPEAINVLLRSAQMYISEGINPPELRGLMYQIWTYYRKHGTYEHGLPYLDKYVQLSKDWDDTKQHTVLRLGEERHRQQQRIYELELEQKKSKLQHQERELTLTTSQLASQVDLLSHFRNDLREIVRGIGDPIDALRSIKQKLKELPCEQIDWAKFEADFVSVHPEFRSLLAERFPNLTAQEIKMCLLVRLGLKNAEIARLTCLSERTVDNHRFNLRKKLGIKTEQNLTQFLATIK